MKKSYIKYLLSLLIFGSNGVVASYIHLSSYYIVLLRVSIGAALLLGIFFLTGHRFSIAQHRRDYLIVGLSGAALAANWLFLYEAYVQIGVGLGTLISYIGPVFIIALSPLLLKERLTFPKVIALVVALLGAVFISGGAADGLSPWGLLCAGLSAVAYTLMVLANKLSQEVKGVENATWQLFCAAVVVAVFVGCKQGFAMQIAPMDWFPILLLGIFNTGVGCSLYFSSMGVLPAQSVAVCGYLEPLFAVLLSAIILHETMSPLQIVGAVLVIGGAVFGECYRGKRTRAAE